MFSWSMSTFTSGFEPTTSGSRGVSSIAVLQLLPDTLTFQTCSLMNFTCLPKGWWIFLSTMTKLSCPKMFMTIQVGSEKKTFFKTSKAKKVFNEFRKKKKFQASSPQWQNWFAPFWKLLWPDHFYLWPSLSHCQFLWPRFETFQGLVGISFRWILLLLALQSVLP